MLKHHLLCNPFKLLIIIVGVLTLTGMTSSKEVMNPEIKVVSTKQHLLPIELRVRGATAGIQPDYFEESLVEAITDSDIFSDVKDSVAKPYSLNVRIIKVDAPAFSLQMAVNMNAVWDLTRTDNGTKVLHETISSLYTGSAFEGGLIGANRVRAAAEGAARENIRLGLDKISSLNLNQSTHTTAQKLENDQ